MAGVPSQNAEFSRLFATHRGAVWAYCCRRLPSSEVSDAVAEVFLQTWRRIDRVPEGDESLLWLYGVARNVVRNSQRSERRRRRLRGKVAGLSSSELLDPEVEVFRRVEDRALLEAVERLDPLERELLRLRNWEELSISEVAAIVGMSARAVESHLARTRKRLESILSRQTAGRPRSRRPRPVEESRRG